MDDVCVAEINKMVSWRTM